MNVRITESPRMVLGGNMRDQGYNRDALAARNNAKPLVVTRKNSYGKDVPYFTGC